MPKNEKKHELDHMCGHCKALGVIKLETNTRN